jgi:hypothetical protein
MVPIPLKLGYTAFVVLLVPIYWRAYGAANFLWFSDIALLVTAAALWLESPLLASMQAVSVLILELAWIVDYLIGVAAGVTPIGIAKYMFEGQTPPLLKWLSGFHFVLPFVLLWLVHRLGYDGRGFGAQVVAGWAILLICYLVTDPAQNINWVFGPSQRPQTTMPPMLYLLLLMVLLPICVYWPTHLTLRAFMPVR